MREFVRISYHLFRLTRKKLIGSNEYSMRIKLPRASERTLGPANFFPPETHERNLWCGTNKGLYLMEWVAGSLTFQMRRFILCCVMFGSVACSRDRGR